MPTTEAGPTTTTISEVTTTTTIEADAGAGLPTTTTAIIGELPATGGGVPYWSLMWLAIALAIPGVILTAVASRRSAGPVS